MRTVLGSMAACLISVSCGVVEYPLIPGSQAALAKDQIMLVRKEPPSFGYQRLQTQAGSYPDLAVFVTKHGNPDFLAETGNWERRYFILYYLESRQAFACRTRSENHKAVEFAGPYPITPGEYKLLKGFQRNANKKLAPKTAGIATRR
ncbi:MAG: hypothetical protein ABIT37_14495 [Luteolibacter sp.]